ncbi:thioesterase family protein [Nocardioides convexus]|uniref:PaaI family thioesterase n=1 Tax=Nocardioides convexus TaxID=2712224 RepID=UPI003100C5F9
MRPGSPTAVWWRRRSTTSSDSSSTASERLAVTRSLTVEYLRPVLLGTEYEFTARVRDHAGRRLRVDAEAVDQVGDKVATAHATFIVVDLQHFEQGMATTGP